MSHSYIVTEQQRKLDLEMAAYDIWGTRAHVIMLQKIGVLSKAELRQILDALKIIETRVQNGEYQIDPNLGAQLTLEREIGEITGRDISGKVHTGRSRNDQVTTAQKLDVRDKLLESHALLFQLVQGLVELAQEHIETVMPGYTHMQPAKPTTFGQWCLAYADMFLRDTERLKQTFERHNISPLGAAESYGTSWPLDRELTASLMGFDRVHEVPMDVIATRGEMEAEIISNLSFVHLHLSKMAQDLLLLNTFEFGMVELDKAVAQRMGKVTGSSIMPQKKNPDVLELVRANTSVVFSMLFQIFEILKSLPFGYNRDSRESKEAVVTALQRYNGSVAEMQRLLTTLGINKERMLQSVIANYSLATDVADYLASYFHVPYRYAYTIVGKAVDRAIQQGITLSEVDVALFREVAQQEFGITLELNAEQLQDILDPVKCLARRKHIGGAAASEMARMIEQRLRSIQQGLSWIQIQQQKIAGARESTLVES